VRRAAFWYLKCGFILFLNQKNSGKAAFKMLVKLTPVVNPTKLCFFFVFPNFAIKLGHFKVQTIFSYAKNIQA
jgi:hypothetical protein